MPTAYPVALDVLNNPSPSDSLDTPGVFHDVQHQDANDAIEAIQAKVGVNGSSITSTLDYLVKKSNVIISPSVAVVPYTIRGAAGQTADLQKWQSSASVDLVRITAAGDVLLTSGSRLAVAGAVLASTVVSIYAEGAAIVPLRIRGFASQTARLQEWQNSAGAELVGITSAGNMLFTNTLGSHYGMAAGNAGYVNSNAANQLSIRGGSGGIIIRNNADNANLMTISDAGIITAVQAIDSWRHTALTNVYKVIDYGIASLATAYSPVPYVIWHNILAFHKHWGTPTFERYSGSWSSTALSNTPFDGMDASGAQIIDGTTYTAARWTWNSSNIAFSYALAWFISFPYQATFASKNFLLETSADGTNWTTRHTSTGFNTSTATALIYVTDWGGDTYVRLTITVTNGQPLLISCIRALTQRPGSQGGGQELELPYYWDSSQRISIGAGSAPANAPLTVGTNTTASTGGMYFGTDTPLYRSGVNILSMTGTLNVAALNVGGVAAITGLIARKNSGANVGTRPRFNFIEGTGISLTLADDAGGGEIDITVSTAGALGELDPLLYMGGF